MNIEMKFKYLASQIQIHHSNPGFLQTGILVGALSYEEKQ